MMRSMLRLRFAVAALFLAFLSLPLYALAPTGQRWTKTTTKNLVVYSNARDSATKSTVASFERMRIALGHIMGLRTDSPVPMTVFLFNDEAAFAPVRKAALGERASNQPGLFAHETDRAFIAMELNTEGGVDRIVYHELTHSLIENTLTGLPLWYQEGVADFYSTFRVVGKTVIVGEIPKDELDFVSMTGVMPLRRVFAIDPRSKEYTDSHAGNFYATSWLMVHYLLVGAPQRAGQLGRFLQLLDAQKPIDVAFQSAFGTTIDQFQGELWSYLNRSKKQSVSYTFPDVNAIAIPAPVVVDEAEMLRAIQPMLDHAEHAK